MDVELKALIAAVRAEHPGPWNQKDGYSDGGAQFTSIVDLNGRDVFDGEFGHLSESVFELLLNFPDIAASVLK